MERQRLKVWRILTVAVTVLVVAGLLMSAYGGLLDPRSCGYVPGVMVLLLPLVGIAAVAWAGVVALMRRWWQTTVLGLALLLSLPSLGRVCPVNLGSDLCENDSTFTVMTYNVAGFPHLFTEDSCHVIRTILDINADVVLMQEMPHTDYAIHYDTIRSPKNYFEELNAKFPYRSYSHKDEVAIMSKYPFVIDTVVPAKKGYDTVIYHKDLDHYPALAFDVVINGHKVRLFSAHLQTYGLSNADKRITGTDTDGDCDVMQGSRLYGMSFGAKLDRAFSMRADDAVNLRNAIDRSPETVIVCGDFNDVPGSFCYRTLAGDDMKDAWTECGLGYAHTYNAHRFYFKIDHILYRGNLRAVDARVYSDVPQTYTSSDHYPHTATFKFY
ncbi:endonuclease/exonuclease/phosphatase family protein [Sodaliphilus sp.]|uniref:endonuclease/exonuclease/phosphatase family protein n=1 Tax=Sodaliphilus sp. TaxID=2815818 RepID=UPI00388FF963